MMFASACLVCLFATALALPVQPENKRNLLDDLLGLVQGGGLESILGGALGKRNLLGDLEKAALEAVVGKLGKRNLLGDLEKAAVDVLVGKLGPKSTGFNADQYVTKSMNAEMITKMKEVFDIFDYDHSGQVSVDELVNTIKALDMEEQAKNILNIVQSSSSAEELDFKTFLDIFGFNDSPNETSLQQLYEIFDPTGSNCFGPEDFEKVCDMVGEKFSTAEVDQIIDYADKDRDGGINYEEFVATLTREYPRV